MSRPATIEDVARQAGVSRQTVSRAINAKNEIHPDTRQRVLQAVADLGYRPSRIARSLVTRASGTIGLVIPDIANPFFPEIARGVEGAANALGYQVFLSNTDEDPEREWRILVALQEQRAEGIILCSSRLEDARLSGLIGQPLPLVLLNRRAGGAASLLVDDADGARQATEYLLARGHQRIGLLRGPLRSWSARQRYEGYRSALRVAGLQPAADWVLVCAPQVEAGRIAAGTLLRQAPKLTALLCYNDLVALGAIQACQNLGRAVPADCAVIGADDIPLAALMAPALTTVQVDKLAAGRRAMALLHRLLAEPPTVPPIELLETRLIVRASA